MKFEFESIFYRDACDGTSNATWRAKVIGGWIICNTVSVNNIPSTSMQFIPDENHEWKIEE